MAATVRDTDLDSLAHLEERITRAVEVLTRLRTDHEAMKGQLDAAVADRDAALKEAAAANVQAQKARRSSRNYAASASRFARGSRNCWGKWICSAEAEQTRLKRMN